jgi:hypothetical protein
MRYVSALLFALTMGVAVALGPALAQDGPSVCHHHDGTLLNLRQMGGVRGAALARAFLNSGPHDWRQLMNGQ